MERATIYAVARRAGVSITTVSRVLNENGPVAPATRARILRAIRDLEYQPSWVGRALAGRRHGAVGIVFPDLAGPYHTGVIAGLESWAAKADLALFILGTHCRDRSGDLVAGFAEHVDGLVLTAMTLPDAEVRRLRDQGIHVVLLGRPAVDGIPAVCVENRSPGRELVLHLIREHGLRRLRFVGDPNLSPDVEERWEAFQEAHREAGVKTHASPVRADLTQEDGQRAVAVLLTRSQRPQGLVCANDEIALGAYAAAARQGLAIPGDLEVTGWDDIAQAGWIVPSLTTVHQPLEELGFRAGQRLQRLLGGEGAVSGIPSDGEMWDATGDRDGSSVETAVERTARAESLAERTTTWIGSRVVLRQSCGCRVAFVDPLS